MLFSSCYIAHKEQKRAFGCYKENFTCIDSLIETRGYYEYNYYFPLEPQKNENQPVKACIIFYKDGSCVQAPTKEFLMHVDSVSGWNFIGLAQGKYFISNDTITIKLLYVGSSTSSCQETKLKILDYKRLQEIYDSNCIFGRFDKRYSTTEVKFVPYDVSPINDDLWIKKKRWFWCDKNEYKAWEKRRRK